MTLDELIVQWYKRGLEVAGTPDALNQCVDLANGYIRDVLHLPIIEWTDAKDFPSKAGDKYEYIKNAPNNAPQMGDIPVWNGHLNETSPGKGDGPGHIAIALGGDTNSFVSFDENWSVSQRCTLERHTYDYVDGWLRCKDSPFFYRGYSLTDPESMKVCVDVFLKVMNKEYVSKNEYDTVIAANSGLKKKLTTATEAYSASQDKVRGLDEQIKFLNEKLSECQTLSWNPVKDYETIANIRAFGHHYGVVKFLNE